ncbi:hypothetical protein PVL30_002063 [Lodderomyces elongisporus]|uniref:uncharacterized protein n=1 Tax=Lodderomyces elongisporus TaxID=36914 RepID=UPI00292246DD|nr:uncharacterized protein PVL30_002063 [Lodderomyces elongisporus]WLF78329.1 hypothetical protein PVL30_002063 [Lodderomyces elongisporus]
MSSLQSENSQSLSIAQNSQILQTPQAQQAPQAPQEILPLTLEQLQPFPLPKQLNSLPNPQFTTFTSDPELIKGYIHSLESYRSTISTLVTTLTNVSTSVLQEDIRDNLIPQYEALIDKITNQVQQLTEIHKEYLSMETIQYQLLSTNFNSNVLMRKFQKMIEESNNECKEIVQKYHKVSRQDAKENSADSLTKLIHEFRESRKSYHLRKEKMNRWQEERVSGFI